MPYDHVLATWYPSRHSYCWTCLFHQVLDFIRGHCTSRSLGRLVSHYLSERFEFPACHLHHHPIWWEILMEESSFLNHFLIGFLLGMISSLIILARLMKKIDNALRHTSHVSKEVFHRILSLKSSPKRYRTTSGAKDLAGQAKAWVLQLIDQNYDPSIFSLSMTCLCLIELRQTTLFILRTASELDRKLADDELDEQARFNQIDIYSLEKTTVGLLPAPMARSKYWSKKTPLVLQNVLYLGNESMAEAVAAASFNLDLLAKKTYQGQERKTLQLFTRTRRSKEDWFYRLVNATQIDAWRREIDHRMSSDFQSDNSSTVIDCWSLLAFWFVSWSLG